MNIILVYVIVIASTFTTGFGLGYRQKGIEAKATYSKVLKIELDKQKENVKIVHNVEKVYLEKLVQGATVYKTIHKDIVKYVPVIQKENSDCNLTTGTVRLLNDASSERIPTSTRDTSATDTKPSLITGEGLIRHTERIISLYNRAKTQCNSLIEFNRRIAPAIGK